MGTLTNSAKLIEKIQNMRSVVTGNTAPSNPSAGDLWYDTTSTVKALKMYDGTSWVIVGPELVSLTQAEYDALPAAEKSNGKFYLITDASGSISIAWSQITGAPISSGSSAPSNPNEGDIWYDTTNDVLKAYNGTSWSIVGDDSANVNTKTFYLSSTSDLTNAQAAYDWYTAGNEAIIKFSGTEGKEAFFFLKDMNGSLYFSSSNVSQYNNDGVSAIYCKLLRIFYSNSVVSGVTITNQDKGSYLDTNIDYSGYTPLYNGSPATKKYVDDSVASVDGITTTQPLNPAAGSTYYDTTNNVIKVYDGTTWISIGGSPDMSNYLAKDNTTTYTPSGDYNPATKKYVDDLVGDVESLLAAI